MDGARQRALKKVERRKMLIEESQIFRNLKEINSHTSLFQSSSDSHSTSATITKNSASRETKTGEPPKPKRKRLVEQQSDDGFKEALVKATEVSQV